MLTKKFDEIDWDVQWATHARGYREGYLHVDLQEMTGSSTALPLLKLKPGPGFGDLSHPTTRLVLRLMSSVVRHKHVLDVGCGSGILSFAASAMGAASVCGIDIDDQALIHSRLNSTENGMSISFMRPEEYCLQTVLKPTLPKNILMNMIQSEQCVAWNSLTPVHSSVTGVISSGILADDHQDYLKLCREWGWSLAESAEEDGWMAFRFFV
ncbi:MAG: 50S ribosomal protein L11 methyltransferase [Parachlamydiaceae bacterium]